MLQVAMQTRADLANSEVITLVKKLARDHHSAALAQLASRISVVVRYGSKSGDDPFVKVKGLISDMIVKLEKEAEAEATEKAYCDEQMAKTQAKKEDLDSTIAKLTSKIDQSAARSASLKEEVVELEKELLRSKRRWSSWRRNWQPWQKCRQRWIRFDRSRMQTT